MEAYASTVWEITPHCKGQILPTSAASYWERLAWLRILSTHHFVLNKLQKWHKSLYLPSRIAHQLVEVNWSTQKVEFLCFVDIVYQKMFKIAPNRLRNDPYQPAHFGKNTENGWIFFNSVKRRWKYIKFALRITKKLNLTSDPPLPP